MVLSRRFVVYFPLIALISILALFVGLRAHAQTSPTVVIGQLYGGGGNTGAPLKNDFIELFNAGTDPAPLTGWSVQYASAAGTSWAVTNLTAITLQPGQYYLVQEAAGTGNAAALPAPDQTGGTNMSATAGKVALVSSTTALSCGATCAGTTGVVDFVGFGSANNFEGSGPTAAPSNATAVLRNNNGCVDTNNNAADFSTGAPNPRNTTSAVNPCGGGGGPTSTATTIPSPSPTATLVAGCTTVQEIQGASHISPCNNLNVNHIEGIVTSIYYTTSGTTTSARGFYIQAPSDGNDSTSDGVLIFTNSTPTVHLGDSVSVDGRVSEFRPGSTGLTVTEIGSPVVTVLSSGNAIPAPVVIGIGGRVPPTTVIEDDSSGNVETSDTFDPANDGIDFYESLEGMLVQVNNAVVVGPTNQFNETWVLADNGAGAGPRTARGGIRTTANDFNPERMMIDDESARGLGFSLPLMNVADTIPGPVVGVMSYDFGDFRIHVTQPFTSVSGGLMQEVTDAGSPDQLTIATFNVENLDPGDPATKFAHLGSMVATNLRSPDIVTVEEVQDNNGETDDGTVDASTTWGMLISAISAAGGPTYQYREIDPVNGQDGGAPGGNIRQGFLFNPARVSFVDRPGGDSTTANTVVCASGQAQLQFSPGRLSPADSAWTASRKPIAGEFSFNGHTVIIIGNHFNSKLGDDPLYGFDQPPVLSSATQRTAQATIVHDFINGLLSCQSDANVITLGDLNDYQFSAPVQTLKGTILDNLLETLPENEQYSYDFEGNSQVLDQILVSHNLTNTAAPQYDVVHLNAEFYNDALPGSVRTSDHDPSLASLSLPVPPTATPTPTATNTPTNTPTATNTPTSTPTPTATQPARFERLNLSALCTPSPRSERVWQVSNSNPFPVNFSWLLLISPTHQSGSGVVPAASGGHAGTTTFFTTHVDPALDIAVLFANDQLQDLAIGNPLRCTSAQAATPKASPTFQPPTNTPAHK